MKNLGGINIRAGSGLFENRSGFLKLKTISLTFSLWVNFLVSLLFFHPAEVSAIKCSCTFIPATLIEVVDGETAWFRVDGEKILVRFEGIDAPDLKDRGQGQWCPEEGVKALEARNFVIQSLNRAKEILIDLEDKEREGIVHTGVYADGLSVGQELLYKYLVVEEDSGYADWCRKSVPSSD